MERLDAFMARANAAYYASHDPFADFTTAPEISQAFGEILGLWAAVTWQSLGAPDPVLLVEAGPGRGTLMADALRAISRAVPGFHAALRVHLIETSQRLRAAQIAAVPNATWHDDITTLPDAPLILLANEFLDALPIRQRIRRGTRLMEHFVRDGQLIEVDAGPAGDDMPEGVVHERNDAACDFIRRLSVRLAQRPGAALLLDYGPAESAPGDSLQALRDGKPADPLSSPGTADLTAHVDFAALARVAAETGIRVHGPIPQGMFLTRIGLLQRTGMLARTRPPAAASAMLAGAQRLIEPDRMGRLFKAMTLCSANCPTPPGLAG